MKRSLLVISFLAWFSAWAQQPADAFDYEDPNLAYLEYLTWTKINDLRQQKAREALAPDSLLLLAARDHAGYIKRTGKQSHFQKGEKAKEDPQLRIEFFGCVHVLAGENILYLPAEKGIQVRFKSGNRELKTYEDYAKAMADIWKNSRPHYANILSRDFQISALALSYDKDGHSLYGVQVFGQITGAHQRTETNTDFPYFDPPAVQKKN